MKPVILQESFDTAIGQNLLYYRRMGPKPAPARAAAARKLEGRMSGRIAPRRIGIHGRQTSIRLERPFWLWLRQIAAECGCSAKLLIECIYASKSQNQNLSSAIRIYVAAYFYGSVPNHALVDPTSRLPFG
jgi:predicted DNA-binding ribbon-helix-helix protein